MAISVSVRPRVLAYMDAGSPGGPRYSYWNAAWNPIVYEFAIPLMADRTSSLKVDLYEVGTNTLLASNNYRPFTTGNLIVDVAPYIRDYLFSAYSPDLNEVNSPDAGNTLRFYLTYQQILADGTILSTISEQQYPISASCSAMQFGDQNDGNMLEYVPFPYTLTAKANFLSAFERPVMWTGYPFTLSFIYNQELSAVQLYRNTEEQNINGQQLTVAVDELLEPSGVRKINYLTIDQPAQSSTRILEVYLHTGDEINDYYVDQGYVDNGYHEIV